MARKKAGNKQAADTNPHAAVEENKTSNVQADHDSIAIGGLSIGGDLSGSLTVGVGYTAEQVSLLLTQITSNYQRKPFDGRCPYKGLEVFEEEDAELFFGRERLVEDLVSRVKESRSVFITGPSGSGKSSLVRAGLIHALKQGAIKNSERWLFETMKPGRELIKELALAFSRLKSPELAKYFQAQANEVNILNECAESVLSGRKDQRFVLFVDQFEETFTQINQEEERLAFLNMLAHAATVENGRVIVVFAMRSDFLSNCAAYPMLNELLSQEFRQIGAMQPEELVAAIALPAVHVGLPVEDELIARIINDMRGEPGALPLMQFALKDLFDSQEEKGGVIALTLEDYLHHGGIHKSLERHADSTFAKLNENEQELARSIFSGLIEIGRGTQDTKRTALFDELVPANTKKEDVEAIVQRLADARLIITDEQAGKDTVTISHEKLIDAWPWLKKLVNENRDVIALQNEIASDAKEWEDHKRDASYLYTGARLAGAREQLALKRIVLGGLAQTFVDSSIEAVEAEQQREEKRRQRELEDARRLAEAEAKRAEIETQRAEEQTRSAASLRKRSLYLTVALVLAIGAIGVAVWFGIQARRQANVALARQLAAQAQSLNATRSSRQWIAALLSIQSMNVFPTEGAASFLLTENFAAPPISRITHEDVVNSVAFSPDGTFVVSGSGDGTARVWEAQTGEEVARMTHDGPVTSVAFSPDGNYVLSGSEDGTARVWEAQTGREVARMTHEDEDGVYSAAFSPDGKYVVSGSNDGTAHVWEAQTGEEVARMTHTAMVSSVAFSPDGQFVVSGSWDITALVWEAQTGKEIARMTHEGWVFSVAFSPDGKYVVSGSNDGTAHVWEAQTGEEVTRMTHDGWVTSLAFSPDGNYVVSGGGEGTARVWYGISSDLIANACADLPRNLTRAEWKQYIGDDLLYRAICPDLPMPIEPEGIPTP